MARWRTTLTLLVALVAVGCTSGDDDGAPTTSTTLFAPLPDDGIVVVEEWFDGDEAEWVARGDAVVGGVTEPGEIVVLVPEGGDPTDDEAVVLTARPPFAVGPGVDDPSFGVAIGMPCGSTSLVVDSPGGLVRVASRATPLVELEQIGRSIDVNDAGEVVLGDLAGWTEVGGLPAGWGTPRDGSRASVGVGVAPVAMLARRLDPSMVTALDALVCSDPGADLTPPPSVPPSFFEAFRLRRVDLGGTDATVAALGTYSVVAFTDDRLVELRTTNLTELTDADVQRLLGDVVALPDDEFEARRADLVRRRGDAALEGFVRTIPQDEEVVADGWLGEARWVLHAAVDDELGPIVCLHTVRDADGSSTHADGDLNSHALCPVDVIGAPELAFGFSRAFHATVVAFAEVPASASTVELAGTGDQVLSQLVDDTRGRRYLLLALRAEAGVLPPPRVAGEDVAPVRLADGGTATVTVRDADGAVVAQDTIGG